MVSSFTRFLNHTQRRTTIGRTPLDEWSARRRDLYLTTHNTHNRQTSIPSVGFEPTISVGERPQTCVLNRAATGTGLLSILRAQIQLRIMLYQIYLLHHRDKIVPNTDNLWYLQFYIFTILYWLHILPYRITTTRSRCILNLWDSFLWITVSSFLKILLFTCDLMMARW
jgi:hypothetical protein